MYRPTIHFCAAGNQANEEGRSISTELDTGRHNKSLGVTCMKLVKEPYNATLEGHIVESEVVFIKHQ